MKPLWEGSINTSRDIVAVRQQAKRLTEILGLALQDQTRFAAAASEVAREVASNQCQARVEFVLEQGQATALLTMRIHALCTVAHKRARKGLPTVDSEGLIAARRLVDHFDFRSPSANEATIELGKRVPLRAASDSVSIAAQLHAGRLAVQDDLNAAFNEQNRELIASLQELQDKQAELQRLNHELQDTNRGVVALYAELEEKAEQLRAASEAKSKFLANVSHEFRTPLNSILALSRLLLDEVDGQLEPEQGKQISFIRRSAETLLEFVNDLLDLAKVEAGKIDVRSVEVPLPDFMRGLRGVLKPLKTSDEVELVFEDVEPIALVTDEGKLAQILRNLISNALKFTERGEVRVSVKSDCAREQIRFEVRDTGIGISPHDQRRIFGEFEQVAGQFQLKNKGSGLGLALSQKLADLLRGEITLASTPGVGSTFTLTLPLDARPLVGESTSNPKQRTRVLVVDDEETFRYVARHIVESEPTYELIEAQDGAEGLARAQRDEPDVMILDLQMPVMSGHDVLKALAADPRTRDIPVIISTSLPLTGELQADLAGATQLLSKSNLSKETLLGALGRALQQPSAGASGSPV